MTPELFYLCPDQIQAEINARFAATNEKQNPYQVIQDLYLDHRHATTHCNQELTLELRTCPEDGFLKRRGQIMNEYQSQLIAYKVAQPHVPFSQIPLSIAAHKRSVDVFVDTVFYNAASAPHAHEDLFEVLFVYQGQCHFVFEGVHRLLNAGDFCIIAPGSQHDVYIDGPEDFIIQQFIYSAHFRTSFINILEDDSIIPNFFKMILANKDMCNYLLFATQNNTIVRQTARSLFLEQYTYDEYSPSCTLYWMQLLFSYILRDGIHTYQLSSSFTNVDFAPILEYLQENYKTASLSDVAARFHYSVAYLSTYIKRITGKSYSAIIKDLKLREATEYLLYTEKSIDDISLLVGYHSADHFSRVFRASYGMSPSAYRAAKAGEEKLK